MIDLGRFRGTLPYATELFGVYQPLLGWTGRQALNRVDRESVGNLERLLQAMLDDARLRHTGGDLLRVIEPTAALPSRIPTSIRSLIGTHVSLAVAQIIQGNNRLPTRDEWNSILSVDSLRHALDTLIPSRPADVRRVGVALADELAAVSPLRESLIAGVLAYVNAIAPRIAERVFLGFPSSWEVRRDFIDPLNAYDPRTRQAVLSPVGILHLYRQYFFDFGTFLGPSVGHVWLSPGGTVELFEVHTRRTIQERQTELTLETITRSEITTTEQDELSDAVKQENSRSVSLGMTASARGNWGVYQAEASASYNTQRNHLVAEEMAHKHVRQQSEKLSNEIRRNFKAVFKTTVEEQDTSSRRYVIQNSSNRLVNYELRSVMRQVGIQLQSIGTQLCWQVYIDEAGRDLGIAELIHVAKPEDLNSGIQPPDAPPTLPPKESELTVDFPFEAAGGSRDTDEDYTNGDDGEGNRIIFIRDYTATPPGPGYTLHAVQESSIEQVDFDNDPPSVAAEFSVMPPDHFRITLKQVNFHDQTLIRFVLKLTWTPPDQRAALAAYQQKLAEYTDQRRREAHAQYIAAIRERVKLASKIVSRPAVDLREEERTVIFRHLIRQLMQIGSDETPHVQAELIREIFDVDRMLYFVASEWWRPRLHSHQQVALPRSAFLRPPGDDRGVGPEPSPPPPSPMPPSVPPPGPVSRPGPEDSSTLLTEGDAVGWGGVGEQGRDNYLITEDSEPARMGASLGWLLQLDGDAHRNAFLNSPWIRAVVPIRPGREEDALRWLQLARVEGVDGLNEPYTGEPIDVPRGEPQPQTVREALLALARQISTIASDPRAIAATENVFQNGFDPLEGGFRAPDRPFEPYEIFDQWIEVLPGEGVVAAEV